MATRTSFSFTGRDVAFKWETPPDIIFRTQAEAYARDLHAGVHRLVLLWAPQVEAWMKQNAPWTDRTGAARSGLMTEVEAVVNEQVTLWLSHGPEVEYGVWLEVANTGRFAIISPALDRFGPEIWADVRRMLRS